MFILIMFTSAELFLLLLSGIFVALVTVLIVDKIKSPKKRALLEAQAEYYSSLARLRENPLNIELKEHTLYLGQLYSDLTRTSKKAILFDEAALLNDISQACTVAHFPDSADKIPVKLSAQRRSRTLQRCRGNIIAQLPWHSDSGCERKVIRGLFFVCGIRDCLDKKFKAPKIS